MFLAGSPLNGVDSGGWERDKEDSTTHVDAVLEVSRDPGSIPGASTNAAAAKWFEAKWPAGSPQRVFAFLRGKSWVLRFSRLWSFPNNGTLSTPDGSPKGSNRGERIVALNYGDLAGLFLGIQPSTESKLKTTNSPEIYSNRLPIPATYLHHEKGTRVDMSRNQEDVLIDLLVIQSQSSDSKIRAL